MNTRPDPRPLTSPEQVADLTLSRMLTERGQPLNDIVRDLLVRTLYLSMKEMWDQEDNYNTTELLYERLGPWLPDLTDDETVTMASELDLDADDLDHPYYAAHNRATEREDEARPTW